MQQLLDEKLTGEHPRLHLRAGAWDSLRAAIPQDRTLTEWYTRLQATAASMITEPTASYTLIGIRLLEQSRKALAHISTLAALYRLDGDQKKADRARRELLAICAFPDWHPPHFLDVAEMTNAAALGYDWLYDFLSPQERELVRTKIIEFGLRPGLAEYAAGVFWTRPFANNWGQVCAGGLTAGALAIANDDRLMKAARAQEPSATLQHTTTNVRNAMMNYAPDGGWPEGPGYWSYATKYTCLMLSSLTSSLGDDFGLSGIEGFADTGMFRIATIGPSGQSFNYADAKAAVEPASEMMWLAQRFDKPIYAVRETAQMEGRNPEIFHLLWSQPHQSQLKAAYPPLDIFFRRIVVACIRSSWTDPDAFFVGCKGGDNVVSHGHLDLGTFVLDALGERWALDLGPDNYDLPDYFGKKRWQYYRMRTEGHNTLSLGSENQILTANSNFVGYSSSAEAGQATFDLTQAYGPTFTRVERRVELVRSPQPRVILHDLLRGGAGKTIRWNMHTRATITLQSQAALLELAGKRLKISISSPSEGIFKILGADAPAPQAQQPDVKNLVIEVAARSQTAEITVIFEAAE